MQSIINLVRNRTGLTDFEGDKMDGLRHEGKIELLTENVQWYDVRRWEMLEENFDQFLYGVYVLEVVADCVKTTTWKQIQVALRKTFDKKLYWIPIADNNMNRAPQLVQNPGY